MPLQCATASISWETPSVGWSSAHAGNRVVEPSFDRSSSPFTQRTELRERRGLRHASPSQLWGRCCAPDLITHSGTAAPTIDLPCSLTYDDVYWHAFPGLDGRAQCGAQYTDLLPRHHHFHVRH